MSGNVKVYCRFRPLNPDEIKEKAQTNYSISNDCKSVSITNKGQGVEFSFDQIFPPSTTQQEIYTEIGDDLLTDILAGINCTIFAYGQSGSGKTFTMTGYSNLVDNKDLLFRDNVKLWNKEEDMGIVARLLKNLYFKLGEMKNIRSISQVSYVEIYLEHIRDLLKPDQTNLKIREEADGSVWIEDATVQTAMSFEDIIKIMRTGEQNRTIGATALNQHSSRSHSALIISLLMVDPVSGVQKFCKLIFVDLAGSEKVFKSKVSGLGLKQAQANNKSLTVLGRIIRQLVDKEKFISYRDSKLTRILSDSLGGTSRTCLIVTCSPSQTQTEETLNTLRFGSLTSQIVNTLKVHAKGSNEYKHRFEEAQKIIQELQLQNAQLQNAQLQSAQLQSTQKIQIVEKVDESKKIIEELATLRDQNLKLNNELGHISGNVQHFQEVNYIQGQELEEKTEILSRQTQEIDSLKQQLKNLDDLRRQNLSLQKELNEFKASASRTMGDGDMAEFEKLRNEVRQLSTNLRISSSQLALEKNNNGNLQEKIQQLLEEKTSLLARIQ